MVNSHCCFVYTKSSLVKFYWISTEKMTLEDGQVHILRFIRHLRRHHYIRQLLHQNDKKISKCEQHITSKRTVECSTQGTWLNQEKKTKICWSYLQTILGSSIWPCGNQIMGIESKAPQLKLLLTPGVSNEQKSASCMEDRVLWRKIVFRCSNKDIDIKDIKFSPKVNFHQTS